MTIDDEFKATGAAMLESLPQSCIDDAMEFLKSRPVHPGCHVWHAARGERSWEACLEEPVLCWHHRDVLATPHLMWHALGHSFDAASILQVEDPVLYSMNVFCTRPGGPLRPDIQDWHRDTDDKKFVPLFTFLTDGNAQEVRFDGKVNYIAGPAGTTFFSNTMLEHRGIVPEQERMIFWARWGVSDPPQSYVWDKLHPIPASEIGDNYPADPWLRKTLRLLVTP